MFEQMVPPTKINPEKKNDSEKAKEKKGVLTEFLKGSRKYIATGLGAMILLLSAESLAKGKPGQTAEDEFDDLDKQVETAKVSVESVNSALKAFNTALDILQVNPIAKEKLRKALDETLGEIEADTKLTAAEKLEGKFEAVSKFRAYLDEKLDAQASKAKPAATPEAAPTTAESGVKVELRKGGAVVIEGETTLETEADYVRKGILKPDYASKIPDKAKFGIGKTAFLGRLVVLAMRIEAAKQAEAMGEKDKAVSLRDAIAKQKQMLQKIYGDILQ